MESEKIRELLEYRFKEEIEYPKKRRIIFWYDNGGVFKEILEELNLENVKIIKLEKSLNKKEEVIDINIFQTKYTLEVLDLESNYLIYSENSRPKKNENFLLDIESYSESFDADRSAMLVEDLSLDRLNGNLVESLKSYDSFFHNKERKDKLKKLLQGEENVDVNEFELGILAVLSNSKSLKLHEILKNIIVDPKRLEGIERWMGLEFLFKSLKEIFSIDVDSFEKFMKILVVVHFYRELKVKAHTNLENYYLGDKNEIYLFIDSLLKNKITSSSVLDRFNEVWNELNLKNRVDELELEQVVQGTGSKYFDTVVIRELSEKLSHELSDFDTYKKYINIRLDNSLWKSEYINYYKGLLSAINILQIKKELIIDEKDSLEELCKNYFNGYYKIDRLYREFYSAYDIVKIDIKGKFDRLEQIISNFYEKDYLDPLLSAWSEKLKDRHKLPQQKDFYNFHVKKSDTRVAVIISDALRFEVASEIEERLLKEANTKEISLTGMLTSLPSITSVGMDNLLPFNDRETKSTMERENILKLQEKDSSAITFSNFKNMYRNEQEDYIKGKKVIYIYHDTIDATGDKGNTEGKTFEACATAVSDITGMSKLLSSLGVVNIYITSDHGFLYERKEVEEHSKLEFKNEYFKLGKRYALSYEKQEEKGCISIDLGEYFGVFSEKNQRIKTQGSGLQFVHGGVSPQEMIVPLIKYRSGANATKSKKVAVQLRESMGKITSNITKFGVYQRDSVNVQDKIIERDVTIALYTENGIKISTEEKIRLNSNEENKLYEFRLTLSGDYSKVILKVIDCESEDILDSKEYEVNLSIASEFGF